MTLDLSKLSPMCRWRLLHKLREFARNERYESDATLKKWEQDTEAARPGEPPGPATIDMRAWNAAIHEFQRDVAALQQDNK